MFSAKPFLGGVSERSRGLLLFMAAVAGWAAMDATAKYLSASYPVPQLVWARFAFHVAVALLMLGPARLAALGGSKRWPLQIARSLCLFGATVFFFTGLRYLPLAETVAIYYVSPMILTALSAFLLREKVGPRRWGAVLAGFAGVLLIVRPGSDVFHWAALLPLGSALCFAFYQLTSRVLSRDLPAASAMLYIALAGTLFSSGWVAFDWVTPTPLGWVLLAGLGVVGYASHFCMVRAFESVSASEVAPYGYIDLVWAALLGFLLFGDLPDGWGIVGSAVIVASGVYIFYRERKVGAADEGPPESRAPHGA